MEMPLSQADLEQAALAVIAEFRRVPELATALLAVIGGMAFCRYIEGSRTTRDVDLAITADGAPNSIKEKLLALPNTPFVLDAASFKYKKEYKKDGKSKYMYIQIDIHTMDVLPYIPAAAVRLQNLPVNTIPWVSRLDLLTFKIWSCGVRTNNRAKRVDANDAQALLLNLREKHGAPQFNAIQKAKIVEGLGAVVELSNYNKRWWELQLNL